MNQHLDPKIAQAVSSADSRNGRLGSFNLEFRRHGNRTRIGQQFVSYPFHMTRAFDLDADIPELLTVYQQSSSGGLYRADNLYSKYTVGKDAAAHVTTQAATMVHNCYEEPAVQNVEVNAGNNSFFAFTPDPLVMFPGAASETHTRINLCEGAVVLLTESFDRHDPTASNKIFDQVSSNMEVRDANGLLLLRDRFSVNGLDFVSESSPVGQWRIVTNCLILGDIDLLPSQTNLDGIGQTEGAILGVSSLPNNAGLGVRCLANSATASRSVCDQLFRVCAELVMGASPASRRK